MCSLINSYSSVRKAQCQECAFTRTLYLWSAVIMFIWLTDGWCTLHSSLYTYWRCQTWNLYIIKSRTREGTLLWLNSNVAIPCWCHVVAGLSYWNNYTSYDSPFVTQDDAPSSSLCHVQSPCSSRPQIGCLSNTECFDKWLSVNSAGLSVMQDAEE